METISTILANITEDIDRTEKVYDTNLGPVRVTSINDDLYRVSIPSIDTEIITHDEYRSEAVTITIRYYGTSPGSNIEIETLLNGLYNRIND